MILLNSVLHHIDPVIANACIIWKFSIRVCRSRKDVLPPIFLGNKKKIPNDVRLMIVSSVQQ